MPRIAVLSQAISSLLQSLGVNTAQMYDVSFCYQALANPPHYASAWAQNRRAFISYRYENLGSSPVHSSTHRHVF